MDLASKLSQEELQEVPHPNDGQGPLSGWDDFVPAPLDRKFGQPDTRHYAGNRQYTVTLDKPARWVLAYCEGAAQPVSVEDAFASSREASKRRRTWRIRLAPRGYGVNLGLLVKY